MAVGCGGLGRAKRLTDMLRNGESYSRRGALRRTKWGERGAQMAGCEVSGCAWREQNESARARYPTLVLVGPLAAATKADQPTEQTGTAAATACYPFC